ncbi:MAG TPA: isochorismatase family cysteine hydrolase [Bryobacteraceae bacterium]|nr:isochorismatase family cysteine hydrolase [Bryobacteraceae bacterium]
MKTVFFDVDTQFDFLLPAGALYVPGAERVIDNIGALNRYAGAHAFPVVSTMDAHAEDDPEFRDWPHHCVAGTLGQHKPAETLLEKRVVVRNAPGEVVIAPQMLVEKQTFDCFTNVNLAAILDELRADRYVVYGVVTEICVKLAAFGLLKTGKRVEIVSDAVRSLSDQASAKMLAEFTAAGGVLATVATILGS